MPRLTRLDWVLLFLRDRPLDRLQLMKALFLLWHRSGRRIPGFFEFVPYMYGPCSFELYAVLDEAEGERLITQAPHPVPRWAPYFLTGRGAFQAEEAAEKAGADLLERIATIAAEVATADFHELLRRVYKEAPDFATRSVVISALPT